MLGIFDYLIIAAYLAGTVYLGVWIGRRIKSGSDFFLAGRSLPWWAIGMSLVATDIGGTDIVGVGGAAYTHGLAVANFEWIGCIPAMIVCAFVFAPHFWRIGIFTIPEFLERRFHVSLRMVLASCWLAFMACNLGVILLASAKMMTVLLGINLSGTSLMGFSLAGQETLLCVVSIALLAALYTTTGGLAAVVYSDVIQCIVMILCCLVVLVLGLKEVGGLDGLAARVEAREAALPASAALATQHRQLILPVDTQTPFPWTAIYFGLALVLSPAYWIGNQAIIQRAFGAKSDFEAKAAYVWGALLKNIIPLIIAVPGLIAFALYDDLADGDHAFPTLAARLMPAQLRGVFIAAFLTVLMSSVDAYLNSAATIISYDLLGRWWRADALNLVRVGRITTACLAVWGVLFALWSSRLDTGIYIIFQTLMSFFQGPALAVLLAGVFWRRATTAGALAGFFTGLVTSVGLFVLNQDAVRMYLGWEPLFQIQAPYLYYSVWSFVIAAIVLIGISLVTRPRPSQQIESLIFRRRATEPR